MHFPKRYSPNLLILLVVFGFGWGLFAQERETHPGDVVFTRKSRLADFPEKEILYEKYGMVLARIPE